MFGANRISKNIFLVSLVLGIFVILVIFKRIAAWGEQWTVESIDWLVVKSSKKHILDTYTTLPCYIVPPAAVQQQATIWFHFNLSWAILGAWYQLVLPLCRSSLTVARQVLFGLPLHLFPQYGIQFIATFAGRVLGRQRMWPVNWMRLFANLDFWILHNLVLHDFLFYLSRISLRF